MASNPCAACKLRRCKCTQECVFAPYFPAHEPHRFAIVHRVFGASNIAKILSELPYNQRHDAVNSLYYEAESRLRDPIYGCVGLIAFLQQRLKKVHQDLASAKKELAHYLGVDPDEVPYQPTPGNNPTDFMPMPSSTPNAWMMPPMGTPPVIPHGQTLVIREPNQPQLELQLQAQQLTEYDTQRMSELLHNREQGTLSDYGIINDGVVTATGFNQMDVSGAGPSLALGSFGDAYQIPQEAEQGHHIFPFQMQTQRMPQPQESQEQPAGQFVVQQTPVEPQEVRLQMDGERTSWSNPRSKA